MFLKTFVIIIQMFSSFILIGLILLQQGKGADMGTSFSSSSFDSLFGATGSASFLSRTTTVLTIVFFISTLELTYLSSYKLQRFNSVTNEQINTFMPEVTTDSPISASTDLSKYLDHRNIEKKSKTKIKNFSHKRCTILRKRSHSKSN